MLHSTPSSLLGRTDMLSPYQLHQLEPPLHLDTSHFEKGDLKSGKYKITIDSPYGHTFYVAAQPFEGSRPGYDLIVSPHDSELAMNKWLVYAFEENRKSQPLYKIALANDIQYVCTRATDDRLTLAPESLMDDYEWGIVMMSEGIGVIYQWLERDRRYSANWAWNRNENSSISLTTLSPTLFTFKLVVDPS